MYSLVYSSDAREPLTDEDLAGLLAGSRARNEKRGLTGMLLFKDGTFMQVLEGDERVVRRTFRRIQRDKRHTNVRIHSALTLPQREFPEWTMGFRRIVDSSPADVLGYDDFLTRGDAGPSWTSPTRARVLLDWFRVYA